MHACFSAPKHKIHPYSGFYDLPLRHGKLKDLKKFDAQFFGVPPKQANFMDPQQRLLMEVAYEAMIDAGQWLPGDFVT